MIVEALLANIVILLGLAVYVWRRIRLSRYLRTRTAG